LPPWTEGTRLGFWLFAGACGKARPLVVHSSAAARGRPPTLSSASAGAPTRLGVAPRHLQRARPASAPPHRPRVVHSSQTEVLVALGRMLP